MVSLEKNKLLLLASSKHKEQYIIDNFMSKSVNTTNISTLGNMINVLTNKYKAEKNINISEFCILYMKDAITEYKKINPSSKFIKQPDYYKLSNDIYSIYGELSIAGFLSNDNNFREYISSLSNNIKEMYEIIDIYKNKLKTFGQYDDIMLFSDLLKSLSNGQLEDNTMLNYPDIEIIGFENLAHRYIAFLKAIKDGYKKNINIEIPYENEILNSYKKNISDFYSSESNNISDFALSIINNSEKIKDYRDNIHFITGYGIKQEIYTCIDEIVRLIEDGTAYYNIAIVFDNAEKYHDIITQRLRECQIDYEERFGEPLWQIPIIPILTSIFSVISIYEGEREVNLEELIKILSSKYISIDGIDSSKIRHILYNDFRMFEIMPESNFFYRLNKSSNEKIKNSILDIYSLIEKITKLKNFKDITDTYITLLNKLNIANTISINKDTYTRDNNALAKFIHKLNELSVLEMDTDYKNYQSILDMIIRDITLEKNNASEKGISLLSSYDVRSLHFKHLFLLGCNSTFLNRKAGTFILDETTRHLINKEYSNNLIATASDANILSRSFFLNIISKLKNDSHIYFSLRYKDDNGSLDIPSVFVEEIFYALSESVFNFENLKKYGAIFRKDYITEGNLSKNEKETLISFFYYKKQNNKLPKNILDITRSILLRIDDSNDKEIMKAIAENIFSNTISVSDIENILLCPQMFIENKMFSTFDTSKHTIGIDYSARGDIYHHCFNMLYKNIESRYGFPLSKEKINDYKNIISEIIENLEKDKAYRLSDEKEIDKNNLKEEIKNLLYLYIEKEIENDSIFIPSKFEHKIDEHVLYNFENGIKIKMKGRIDRIDFHYDSEKNIDGIRIIDYKASDSKIKENDIERHIQLLLYLDFAISEYSKDINSIKYLEVGYISYSYKHISSNYFFSFSNKEELENLLYNSQNENNIKVRISETIRDMLDGEINYNPSADVCKLCQKKNRCKEAILE